MPNPYAKLPFDSALSYLKKKVTLDTDKWDDAKDSQHDAFFTVASAKGSLLTDLHDTVTKGIEQGLSPKDLKESDSFQRFTDGWTDKQKDWRSRIIFETNLRMSYAAGRNARQQDPEVAKLQPYLQWVHGDSRMPRPDHLAMDGKVFRVGSEPLSLPNGFGCFLAGTKIATPNGWINIEQIKQGDLIFGGSGNIKPVVESYAREYSGEIIWVNTVNGESASTPNHRFLTLRGWVRAENLTINDVLVNVINPTSLNKFVSGIDKSDASLSNALMALPVNTITANTLNPDPIFLNKNVNPIRGNRITKLWIKPFSLKQFDHFLLILRRFRTSIGMPVWFSLKHLFTGGLCFGFNLRTEERASGFKLFRNQFSRWANILSVSISRMVFSFLGQRSFSHSSSTNLSPFGISDVLQPNSFAFTNSQVETLQKLENSVSPHTPPIAQLLNSQDLIDIQDPEGFVSGHPLDLFDSLESFRSYAIAHLKISKILHLHSNPHQGSVYNLSVRGDESYCLPVGVVHNCRCRYISLTQRQLDRKGLSVSKIQRGDTVAGVKLEPDEGFDYTPEMPSDERRHEIMAASVARMPQAIGRLVTAAGKIIDGLFGSSS